MAHEVESGVYNVERGVPWHTLGTQNEGFMFAHELLCLAGLDFTVSKQPLFTAWSQVPDHFAIVRDNDQKTLGVVGSRYVPVQNAQVLSFMDNIVGSGQAIYDTAWSLRGGRTVAITAELNQVGVLPNDEEIRTYLTASNNHDGSGKVKLFVTPVRTVCKNTLAMATQAATLTWERKHTTNALSEDAIGEAREALALAVKYQQFIEDTAAELMVQAFGKDDFITLANKLLVADIEEQTGQEKTKVEELLALWVNSPNLENIRRTKWGALNAVAEWTDYSGRYRKSEGASLDDKRAESLLVGRGVALKTKTLELLRAA